MTDVAAAFFKACEAGEGWEGCRPYCLPDATFTAQAEPLAGIETLKAYTEWMRAMFKPLPDATYDLRSLAADEHRSNVVAYAVFTATHTGEGGPVPPTGRRMSTDYVYVMEFEGDQIRHVTKIWHSGLALQALGWG